MKKKQLRRAAPKRTKSKSGKAPSSAEQHRSRPDVTLPGELDESRAQDRLVGRPEAARILDCSVGTVRRHQKAGNLVPVLVDEVDGTVFYALGAVTALAEQLKGPPPVPAGDETIGERDAAAFALLDAGGDLGDLITQLKIPSTTARQIMGDWADIRGGMYVSGEALARLQVLHLSDGSGIRTAEDLIRFLEEVQATTCKTCSRNPVFCAICFAYRPGRARQIADLAVARAEQQRADDERRHLERMMYERARNRTAATGVRLVPTASSPAKDVRARARPGPDSTRERPRRASPGPRSGAPPVARAAAPVPKRPATIQAAPVGGLSSDVPERSNGDEREDGLFRGVPPELIDVFQRLTAPDAPLPDDPKELEARIREIDRIQAVIAEHLRARSSVLEPAVPEPAAPASGRGKVARRA